MYHYKHAEAAMMPNRLGKEIFDAALDLVGVKIQYAVSPNRTKRLSRMREIVTYLCRTHTSMTWWEIASMLGLSSHASVIDALARYERATEDDTIDLRSRSVRVSVRKAAEIVMDEVVRRINQTVEPEAETGVHLILDPSERELLKQAADGCGVTMSEWVRRTLLSAASH
jgi:hypothetical protein